MTDTRWEKADQLFDAALDLPRDERAAFLDEACAQDTELRRLVDRLLDDGESGTRDDLLSPGGALQGPVWDDVASELVEGEDASPGAVIGRYRVVRELGRGGMAVVYLAERADGQFEQQVALKRIKRGIDTDEVLRRFDLERQILARIHHPNIGQLLDGGVDPQGRPYFAMEYVEGTPIDSYCADRRLPLSERIELFLQVARAVGHAHRNLVVHRDIKPSNILVTHQGHVKLLDFGIAKLLDPDAAHEAPLTRSWARVMTPVYASPEQVRGELVTTASDVYQLGLLLYLLLTGQWPYRGVERGAGELVRAICEEEPTRPSIAVGRGQTSGTRGQTSGTRGQTSGTREPTSGTRGQTSDTRRSSGGGRGPLDPNPIFDPLSQSSERALGRWRRQLAGDLDNIILMALRKEPERRYGSVGHFVDDVERYLARRPVSARPDTLLYRAGKFVRRNRGVVATAAAAGLLILALALYSAVRLTQERDRARLAADQASHVSRFLMGLFEVSAPTRSKGEQVTARELLDRGTRDIGEELGDEPALAAAMMTLMGNVYRELALYEEAEPLLRRAVEIRRDLGEDPLLLAESLHGLGRVLEETGHHDAARQAYAEALHHRDAILGAGHPEVARTVAGLGRVLELEGDFETARQYLERALTQLEAALGPHHPDVGRALKDLGAVLNETRQFELSLSGLERGLEILQESYEPDHPYIAETRIYLGDAQRFTGHPQDALSQYESALEILERVYGPDHPVVAQVLTKLGNLLNAQNDPDGAVAAHERALGIDRAALGAQHPRVAESLNNLGLVERRRGNVERSVSLLRESVATFEAALGPDHVDLTKPLLNLAETLQRTSEAKEAVPLYERVLKLRSRAYGPDHSLLAAAYFQLGRLHLSLENPEAAEALLRRALAVGRDHEPHRQPEIVWPRIDLARTLTALQRYSEAEALLLETAGEENVAPLLRRMTHEALVKLYETWGRPSQAEAERR